MQRGTRTAPGHPGGATPQLVERVLISSRSTGSLLRSRRGRLSCRRSRRALRGGSRSPAVASRRCSNDGLTPTRRDDVNVRPRASVIGGDRGHSGCDGRRSRWIETWSSRPAGRSRGVRRPGAPGQRRALRGRLADPARHGPRRGRAAERPRARLAPAPEAPGPRSFRGLDPSHPDPRLLRRVPADTIVAGVGHRPADRSAGSARRERPRSPIATSSSARSGT